MSRAAIPERLPHPGDDEVSSGANAVTEEQVATALSDLRVAVLQPPGRKFNNQLAKRLRGAPFSLPKVSNLDFDGPTTGDELAERWELALERWATERLGDRPPDVIVLDNPGGKVPAKVGRLARHIMDSGFTLAAWEELQGPEVLEAGTVPVLHEDPARLAALAVLVDVGEVVRRAAAASQASPDIPPDNPGGLA